MKTKEARSIKEGVRQTVLILGRRFDSERLAMGTKELVYKMYACPRGLALRI